LILSVSLASGGVENPYHETGIAGGRIGDIIELVIDDDCLVEASFRTTIEDTGERLVVVLVHLDVFAGAEPTHEAAVDTAESSLVLVSDTDQHELLSSPQL